MDEWRKKGLEKGEFIEWLLMLLALSVVIFAIIIPKRSPESFVGFPTEVPLVGLGEDRSETDDPGGSLAGNPTSAYRHSIRLSPGSARTAENPDEEYVIVRNTGNASVNVSGWTLRNGSRTATIPKASILLSPYGYNFEQDVLLNPGESAYVTTGKVGIATPYRITSFKTNICSGYIEDLDRYSFEPSLSRQCPAPEDEPGVSGLADECRDVVESMSLCHNPEIGENIGGDYCADCVDGKDLSNSCVEFIRTHFSYAGCVANHASDLDFYGDEWRLYLGKFWELWDDRHGSIELYDSSGNLVASYSY